MKKFFYFSFMTAIMVFPPYVHASGDHAGGHSSNDMHHWQAPHEAAERVSPVERTSESILRGKDLFQQYCASCHGTEARGDGPVSGALKQKPTDLALMAGKHSDGDFAWKIANGRSPMPGWKGTLSEKQIWDLVNFIQSLEGTVMDADQGDNKKH